MTAGRTVSRSIRKGRILVADYMHGIMELDAKAGRMLPILTARNSESFKGCNDLHIASNGDIYFTDQGQTGLHDPTGRVYRLATSGQARLPDRQRHQPQRPGARSRRGRAVRGDDPRQRGVADAVHEGRQRLQGRPLLLHVRPQRSRRHDDGQRGAPVRRPRLARPRLRVRTERRTDRPHQILRRIRAAPMSRSAARNATVSTSRSRRPARCWWRISACWIADHTVRGFILRDATLGVAPQDEVQDPHGEERGKAARLEP